MNRCLLIMLAPLVAPTITASEKDLAALADAAAASAPKEKPDYFADIRNRRAERNKFDVGQWREIERVARVSETPRPWEELIRDQAIRNLRKRMGLEGFKPGEKVSYLATSVLKGEGFLAENIVYESRPGLVVTANLYLPDPPVKNPPAIIIIHSHHNPRTQTELQDMGMIWARLGCLVLVPDQLGHGERRQHPFKKLDDYPEKFATSRQDYHFRYDNGAQIALIGEALAGWMAWDMMRGVDFVLQRGADPKRVILLGSVAGGGDPCGVTGALDARIACIAPYNFGGPQPETKFPLPDDAELSFNYIGGGSWESTRGLAFSAKEGFLPWVIVASVAPRKIIHAHEFAWDMKRDPVFARYQKIFGWYKTDGLAYAFGRGSVKGMAPESTHCNNIGAEHRKMIYPALKKWFDIPMPEKEYRAPFKSEELIALTPAAVEKLKPRPLAKLLRDRAEAKVAEVAAADKGGKPPEASFVALDWKAHLGGGDPWTSSAWKRSDPLTNGNIELEQERMYDAGGELQVANVWLLRDKSKAGDMPAPLVVAVAQQGNAALLKQRSDVINRLLSDGLAVALVEARGMGSLGSTDRGRTSGATSISASEWMMGNTVLGQRLSDFRTVLAHLRKDKRLDSKRILLWGDSFAWVNTRDTRMAVPYDAAVKRPPIGEPNGPLLALLTALMESDIRGVYVQGGLVDYRNLLASPFLYVPHDSLVPGVFETGDLQRLCAALAPRHLRLEGLITGLNQRAGDIAEDSYRPVAEWYRRAKREDRFVLAAEPSSQADVAAWMTKVLVK